MTDTQTIREAFEREYAVPEHAAWNEILNDYVWANFPSVSCPEMSDKWQAFCDGWFKCAPHQQTQSEPVAYICRWNHGSESLVWADLSIPALSRSSELFELRPLFERTGAQPKETGE